MSSQKLAKFLLASLATTALACESGKTEPTQDSGFDAGSDAALNSDARDGNVDASNADASDSANGDGATGDATTNDAGTDGAVASAAYNFESRFGAGSSVVYGGQVGRQVLIADMDEYIRGLTTRVSNGDVGPTEVMDALNFYFGTDAASRSEEALLLTTNPPTLQTTHGAISTTANLIQKLAGNDTSTDHIDFSSNFRGWSDTTISAQGGGITSPTLLTQAFFSKLQDVVVDWANLEHPQVEPTGNDRPVSAAYLTTEGWDLRALITNFLLVGINYHQTVDDYLDDEENDPGKGILASNAAADGTNLYSPLEHQWDEGFGYFGPARNLADWDVARIGSSSINTFWDVNSDNKIDLLAEYNFAPAFMAGRLDHASNALARTNFAHTIFNAFVEGRALITSAGGDLSPAQLTALRVHRDTIAQTWEKAIAASVISSMNRVLQQMSRFGLETYSFNDHARAWSQAKALSLGFQFNRRSTLSSEQFNALHAALGDRPVLPNAASNDATNYATALRAARASLAQSFGFASENLGDANGLNGW